MTPTEQDNELREAIGNVILGYGHAKIKSFEAACNEAMQLITADRKRVALEARKDQTFKVIQSLVKSGSIQDDSAARALTVFDSFLNAELKAQQEEV